MANPREVKIRLRGVRKTQQITRAMKMVAAVKLRHAQAALANSRPYAERMRAFAADLLARLDPSLPDNPFFTPRPVKSVLLVVVAADRGLCGSMNVNVFRQVLRTIDELTATGGKAEKPAVHLFLIGRKAKDFFSSRQNAQLENRPYRIREAVNFSGIDAAQLGRQCCALYHQGAFDRVEFLYNESSSGLQPRPARALLLPLNLARMRKEFRPLATGNIIFEPGCAAMVDDAIVSYLESEARRILMEAGVAEHAARMLMMDLATKNADDLIAAMQLTMNKLRQLTITNELADITTGTEAVA